jgi:hypothetical protein
VKAVLYKPTSCTRFTDNPSGAIRAQPTSRTALRYDRTANQFVFNWSAPGPGCYSLFLKLADGTSHDAYFKLK